MASVSQSSEPGGLWRRLARLRVPFGFACGLAVLWLAQPTWTTLAAGAGIAACGEALRVWAAGHLEKSREVTRSGPYRLVGHPLYLGSSIIAAGLMVASARVSVAILVGLYLGLMLTAAIRSEEAWLSRRFTNEYAAYRDGRAAPSPRRFSWSRAVRNGEHRAIAGLLIVSALLSLKAMWGTGR
jgi:hypothetical protein